MTQQMGTGVHIMQWNIRGIYSNLENLRYFLYCYKPDLLLLNETWFRPEDHFHHNGYIIYRIDRVDGFGGIATFVKSSIRHRMLTLDQAVLPQLCHLQILYLETSKIYVSNIYIHPNTRLSDSICSQVVNLIRAPCVIIGDFKSSLSLG